jgi:hypothetical protein
MMTGMCLTCMSMLALTGSDGAPASPEVFTSQLPEPGWLAPEPVGGRITWTGHHDNFLRPLAAPPRPVARLDWPDFLADAARLHQQYGTRLVRLPRGVPVPF